MHRNLSRVFIIVGLFISGLFGSTSTIYASQKIHHFNIIAPPVVKSGEAFDITVEAKDKDDKTITNYRGSVYFTSDTDYGATLPAQGKAVVFNESDNGVKTLSKAVIFRRQGNQKIVVNDSIEDAEGSITIRVDEATPPVGSGTSESITIITPEKGSKITGNSVMVSGRTRKNSKVVLILNGNEVATVISDDTGVFTRNLTDITQENNILKANILDGNNNIIGSSEITFTKIGGGILYYATSISPSGDVEVGADITITVDAEPGLTDVSIMLDGTLLTAREQSPGRYIASTKAPARSGTYPINVNMKNILGASMDKSSVAVLNTKEKQEEKVLPAFRNVKATSNGSKVNFNFFVDNLPEEVIKFKIVYGESPESLVQEVTTYTVDKIRQPDGSYTWYIPNLKEKSYAFKIFGVRSDGTLSSLVSEVYNISIETGTCTIGDIGKIHVKTLKDKTILSWDALPEAISYNIYRVTPEQEYQLIQNVKENSYVIHLSPGAIVYEDFAIKALCDDRTESSVPAMANRVQTGPNALLILVVISAILSIFFIRKRIF